MIKHLSVSNINLRLLDVERNFDILSNLETVEEKQTSRQLPADVVKRLSKLRNSLLILRREFNKYRAEHENLTEKEREKIVQSVLNNLSERDTADAFDFAVQNYDSLFFKSLTDYQLKMEIAKQLLRYFGAGYEINLWENIVNNNPAVYDILYTGE